MSTLLDQKEQIINAIINEKNAIAVERNSLEQQMNNLKQRCYTFGIEPLNEGQSVTELMVRLCEKEDLLQQFTTQIAEKVQEIINLHDVIKDLRDVNNEKNRIIDDLNKMTSEKEWNLGEYRQWLTDANNKIDNLEVELNDVRKREKLNRIELDRLTNEIDEKNAKISQLHNKIAKMESEAINVQYEKEMISDEHCSLKLSALREKLLQMEEYVQFQDEELRRLKKKHAETLTNEQRDVSPTSTVIQSHRIDSLLMSEEYQELSSELIILNRKKYKLEEKMKRMENDLQESYEKIKHFEDEQRRTGEEIWLTKERVANQDRELHELHNQCSMLRDENLRLQNELDGERKKNTENGGINGSKFDEMKQIENTLRDEKSKIEWRLGEVIQYWNDAKWKIGELEAGMAHKEWLLDQTYQKIYELDQMYHFRDTTKSVLDGAFLIKKQPTSNRYKWRLAMWNESSPDDLKDYRRIWFEIRAPAAKIVLLSASFVSWECFLLCQQLDNNDDKFGVWIDIPPGRYEFLFVVDGQWTISDNYEICWNEYGTHNNWRHVD
ncbi:unnamed protein product [Cercopithifilaria johnstoni]|uniref:AMP-activated protein kinase glycogen-binding domain-containing protein n=1 Tax=Cercopithifilaria johnstoni TaxID=2874296 RepID=A0A8J2M2Q2_9BILA|nr:unnamed protein product [Cercopithifilaria johnstoni]